MNKMHGNNITQYGSWLRATPPKFSRPNQSSGFERNSQLSSSSFDMNINEEDVEIPQQAVWSSPLENVIPNSPLVNKIGNFQGHVGAEKTELSSSNQKIS